MSLRDNQILLIGSNNTEYAYVNVEICCFIVSRDVFNLYFQCSTCHTDRALEYGIRFSKPLQPIYITHIRILYLYIFRISIRSFHRRTLAENRAYLHCFEECIQVHILRIKQQNSLFHHFRSCLSRNRLVQAIICLSLAIE